MNVFSVLDTSDNEDEQPQKTTAANQQGKKPTSVGNNSKTETKPKEKAAPRVIPGLPPAPTKANKDSAAVPPAAPSANEAEGSKDNIRGGRPRGKEGFRRGDKHNPDRKESDKEPSYPGKKGKREFERRSGTGRGKELSRGGRGPYGFGNVEQEAQEAEKNPELAGEAAAEGEVVAAADDSTPAAAEESAPEPEQPKVLTFEDYLRQRNEARANSSVLGAQKPVRAVKADFAGLVQVSNNNTEDENKGDKSKAKKEKSSNKTQIVDVGFRFEAPEAAADRPFKRRDGDSREGRNGRKPFEGKRDNARPQRSGDNSGPRRQAPSAAIKPEDFPAL